MSLPRNRRSVVVGALLALAVAGAAFAYWTAGGSGTGTADTDTTADLTANQLTDLDPMYPGDSPQTISGDFDNPNPGDIFVGTVTVSIASVTPTVAGADCDADDYTLTGAAMAVNDEVPTGTGVGAFTGATIQFNNKATNQNACKGATVNLAYAIS